MVSGSKAGTHRYWPVIGGLRRLSRESKERTAARFPPAEAPPTMSPDAGSALRFEALVVAQMSASQQSLTPVGKTCSGASLEESHD